LVATPRRARADVMTCLQHSSDDEVSSLRYGVHRRNLRWCGPGFFWAQLSCISVGPGWLWC